MPQIGEMSRKKAPPCYGHRVQWQACPDCGKERWVSVERVIHANPRCRHCQAVYLGKFGGPQKLASWRGGRSITSAGYISVWISCDDFFFPMATKSGRIFEHRLVMARHLGRCLHSWELIHHKGIEYATGSFENKQDNRIENLEIVINGHSCGSHQGKVVCPYCKKEFGIR